MRRSGNRKDLGADGVSAGLSAVRPSDRNTAILWFVTLVIGVAIYLSGIRPDLVDIWVFSIPFTVAGIFNLLVNRNYIALICIAVLVTATYFLVDGPIYTFFILFICLGAVGVAAFVDAIQRCIFYRVLNHIRYVNVREKPTFKDRLVAFIFSVPHDIDTRNILADFDVRSRKFPWGDMMITIGLSMVVGMFFWIYMSFNPSFVNLSDDGTYTVTQSTLLVFTVMLYVPLFIMPFSIFRSLNVRIGSNYRDFKIYNGAVSTIQRMAVPITAAFLYILLAVGSANDWIAVLTFIGISALTIFLIILFSSLIYFYGMEAATVSGIARKWKVFMPVPLMMGLTDGDAEKKKEEVPGTPARDEKDFSEVVARCRVSTGQNRRRSEDCTFPRQPNSRR